jgi:hypothetical protein
MRQAHIGTIRTQNNAGNVSQILTLQASIYGMPFDEWGAPGTTYSVAYVVYREVNDNPISDPAARLARKAQLPHFRRAGTFWVSDIVICFAFELRWLVLFNGL